MAADQYSKQKRKCFEEVNECYRQVNAETSGGGMIMWEWGGGQE